MIPRRLRVSGLHSYRDAVEVEFDEAVEDGLFGIFGPTGSGKSTLLDAMTLALYGRVDRLAGNEVTPMMNVDADELTVTYTFELGGTRYEAHRRLVRRDGSAQQRDAELRNLDDEKTLASQAREVTGTVEELLGMDFEQFTRAVFLPQGKFARFLEDTPASRLQLLEEIFGLDRYGDELRRRARERRDELKGSHDRLKGTIEDELDDVTDETVAELEDQLEQAREHVDDLADREEELSTQAEAARSLQETLGELDEADQQLADLEEQADEIDELRQRVEAAKAAREPHVTLTDLREVREEIDEVDERIEELATTADEREEALDEARQAREDEAEEIDEIEDELDDARARLQALEGDAERLDQLRERRQQAQEEIDEFDGEGVEAPPESLEADLDEVLDTIQRAQRVDQRLNHREERLREALTDRTESRAALLELDEERESLEARIDQLEDELHEAEQELEEAEVAQRATALATQLKDGQPCPVCGSPDHPDPARQPEVPTDELEARVDELDDQLGEARSELARTEQSIETHAGRLDEAREETSQAGRALEETRQQLDEHLSSLPDVLDDEALDEAAETVRAFKRHRRLAQAEETIEDIGDQLDRARERFELVQQALDLDADEPTEAALETARESLQARRDEIEDRREALDEEVNEAKEALEEVKDELGQLEGRRDALGERDDSLAARLEDQLDGAGFENPEALEAAQEPSEVVDELEERVEAFDEDLKEAQADVQRLQEEVDEADIEPAQAREVVEEHELVEQRLGDAIEKRGQLSERLDTQIERLERKGKLEERVEVAEEELTRAQRLTKLLGGRKFVEFLARDRFDTVLDQASRRLAQVSGGQYHLEGSPSEIRVVDHMAGGDTRDLRTLSGGETFMVSLSLALALSDAIQHERGGGYPPIEFFFLDEGFGSLDQETLDQVMRMLKELVDQDVYVGLITHVEEAQRYVPRQVIVEPASEEQGSRVEVVS